MNKVTKKKPSTKLQPVMVRAYSGVFFGYLKSKTGGPESFAVDLVRSRHIWGWKSDGLPRKALNVHDLALLGAGSGTSIGGVVDEVVRIADAKLIVPCSDESVRRLEALPCLA